MQPFREANPDVKFIFLANHIEFLIKDTELFKDTYVWRSDIKKLAEAGIQRLIDQYLAAKTYLNY